MLEPGVVPKFSPLRVTTVPTVPDGGEIVSMWGGATPSPTIRTDPLPALLSILMSLAHVVASVGLKRTVTVWLSPAARLNEPPETILKHPPTLTVPASVPPP